MKLYGEYTTIVTDSASGRIVFAELYDSARQRDRHLVQHVGPRYRDKQLGDRFHIKIGKLSSLLPSLTDHPRENVERIAELHQTPIELLMRAQQIDKDRRRRGLIGRLEKMRKALW